MRMSVSLRLSLKYFVCILLFILCVAKMVDIYLAEHVSTTLSSILWQRENEHINEDMKQKFAMPSYEAGTFPLLVSKGGLGAYDSPKVKRRILTVADSFSFGDGLVNLNDTWWRQVQRECLRRGYSNVEVIGLGKNGASTQDELRWLRSPRMQALQPDFILMGYVPNDPDMGLVCQAHPKNLKIFDALFSLWLPELTAHFQNGYSQKNSVTKDCYPYAIWEEKILEGENYRRYEQLVGELGLFLQNSGIPHMLMTLPSQPDADYYTRRYAQPLATFAAAKIPVRNILGDFVRAKSGQGTPLYWAANPANGHPSPAATLFHAQQAVDYLEQHFPQVLGEKTRVALPARINDYFPAQTEVRQLRPDTWAVTLPAAQDMAFMPLKKKHIVLSFENPVPLTSVHISQGAAAGARVYATVVDKQGFDNRELLPLQQEGTTFMLPALPAGHLVNTLRIVPTTEKDTLTVQLTLSPEAR
ncbi:MAG: hypothetical protein RRY29_04680 [Desulfovibrionaceae bacterium]